jgi:catalase
VAGLARSDWLGPRWRRAVLVALAVGIPVLVERRLGGVSVWGALAVAILDGELVATALYPTTPTVFARSIGSLAGAAAFVALVADGSWRWIAAAPIVVGLIVLFLRWRGVREVDAVTRDRTFVPFLFDEGDRLIDAHDAVWGSTREGGPRQGLRAAHSHGTVVEGTWTRDDTCGPPPDVPLFRRHVTGPVVARFSNFSGEFTRADDRRMAHGLALQLQAPKAAGFTMVMIDGTRFPVATREDFVDILRWFGSRGLDRAKRLINLLFTGRTTIIALATVAPLRQVYSYAERTYHGLNAFYCRFDKSDQPRGRPVPDGSPRTEVPVRYRVSPVPPADPVAVPRFTTAVPSTRLDTELQSRLRSGVPARFTVELVLGQGWRGFNLTDDRVRDPTKHWRWRSPTLKLCTITLDRYVSSDNPDALLFQPFDVPDGIRPSDDEILSARRTAYETSYLRRCPLSAGRRGGPARRPASSVPADEVAP